jgi:cytidylate kinase
VVIAIDGPAGTGKSTVARAVADRLGFAYLDTGAMYRCVALVAMRRKLDPAAAAATVASEISLGERVRIGELDVSEAIRTGEVADAASRAAADPQVRRWLVARQRELLSQGDWVAEGRDIGSTVAPGAELKVFLTATAQERARRRAAQLGADPADVLAEQRARDARDIGRSQSPLREAADATTIDTTELTLEAVIEQVVGLAERAAAGIRAAAGGEGRGGAGGAIAREGRA